MFVLSSWSEASRVVLQLCFVGLCVRTKLGAFHSGEVCEDGFPPRDSQAATGVPQIFYSVWQRLLCRVSLVDEEGCGWFVARSLLLIPCLNTLFLFQLCRAGPKTPVLRAGCDFPGTLRLQGDTFVLMASWWILQAGFVSLWVQSSWSESHLHPRLRVGGAHGEVLVRFSTVPFRGV